MTNIKGCGTIKDYKKTEELVKDIKTEELLKELDDIELQEFDIELKEFDIELKEIDIELKEPKENKPVESKHNAR